MQPHLSITQLKMYLRCPLQYEFRYIKGLKIPPTGALVLGQSVHEGIAFNYTNKLFTSEDLPLEAVLDKFSDCWTANSAKAVFEPNEKPGTFKDDGIGLLTSYQASVAPAIQPIQVEREFQLQLPFGSMLKGFIDLIDDKLRIIDHKTTRRAMAEGAAEKEIQLTGYAWAYRSLYGKPESGLRLDVMVRGSKPKLQHLSTTRTEKQVDQFIKTLERVHVAIQSGLFYPVDNFLCGYCGYAEMCKAW